MKRKLVLGSAGKKEPDAVTLDIDPAHAPDVVHDLNMVPWPFEDNRFENITCHHSLEHLDGVAGPLGEMHRVCKKGGEIYIEVPHHTSWCANSPEHKLRFSYFSLDGYLEGGITKWTTTERKFALIEKKITFNRAFRRYFLHALFNRFPLYYERFWAYIIPAENLVFRLSPVK